jgi:hypothetical protein
MDYVTWNALWHASVTNSMDCLWVVQTFLHGHAMEWWAMEKQEAFMDLSYKN